MINNVSKVIEQIEVLSVQSFNEKYPAWISNSLTTIELKLKETLKEIADFEIVKNRISKLNVIKN
jgi:hypothetical protein